MSGPLLIWDALFAYLHLLAAGLTGGLVLAEYWMCRRLPDRPGVQLLGQLDLALQLSLIGVLATGLVRLLHFGRGAGAMLANQLFWLKMALFLALWATSALATAQVIRWNREARARPVFAPLTEEYLRLRALLALQLGLLALLPLISVLVARGYGYGSP